MIFGASATCPASSEARVKRPNERFQLTSEVISRFGDLVRPLSLHSQRGHCLVYQSPDQPFAGPNPSCRL